jgi:capsular polysaccharide biosynthesis protein
MYLPVAGVLPEASPNSGASGDLGLPFDLPTMARSLLRRWRWGLVWAVASSVIGILAGLVVGARTYTAETVLLHRHQPSVWTGLESAPMDSLSLNTKLHLVKVKSNLEETRRRLELAATISQLGSAVDAISQKNADLMIIRAEWGSAHVAAALANTVAAVFFQSQVRIRYREELAVVERMWREERATAQRLEAQINDLSRMTDDLRNRIDMEMESSPADEGLGQLNIRISQLRDAIHDDQQQRANSAMLIQREAQLERARELFAQGMISSPPPGGDAEGARCGVRIGGSPGADLATPGHAPGASEEAGWA